MGHRAQYEAEVAAQLAFIKAVLQRRDAKSGHTNM